jgi:hypothetical protein
MNEQLLQVSFSTDATEHNIEISICLCPVFVIWGKGGGETEYNLIT